MAGISSGRRRMPYRRVQVEGLFILDRPAIALGFRAMRALVHVCLHIHKHLVVCLSLVQEGLALVFLIAAIVQNFT